MFTKKIEYTNFLGEKSEATLRFHVSQSEIVKYISTIKKKRGDITRMMDNEDSLSAYAYVEDLVDLSYGVLSDDGESFRKTPEDLEAFKSSPRYDAFLEWLGSAENFKVFQNAVFPPKIVEILEKGAEKKSVTD